MKVRGIVSAPGDKSISHRALMLAALSEGKSRIEGILDSADVRSTASVLRSLGIDLPEISESMEIQGRGLRGLRASRGALDCGNSGTTARLMAGIVAGHPFKSRFEGDASLSRRPMRRVAIPLRAMGARVEFERDDGLPMEITGGALEPIEWRTESASAQIKSAVLLAALVAGVDVTVEEPAPSRDHTERMLRARGADCVSIGNSIALRATNRLTPVDVRVPGDPSSAAYFAALAAMASTGSIALPEVGINPGRTGFFSALRRMGAAISFDDERDAAGEPVATVRAAPRQLRGIDITTDEVPAMLDELPLLACVAAVAEGTTTIVGAAELRVKESDRIAAVVGGLRDVGAEAEEQPEGLIVRGSRRLLRGRVRTFGDHRLAMAFGVLGSLPGNQIEVDDRGCVAVSYPGFWSDLDKVLDS